MKKAYSLIMIISILTVSNLSFFFQSTQPVGADPTYIQIEIQIYRIELADDGDGGCGWWPIWETCGEGELFAQTNTLGAKDVENAEDYIQNFYPNPNGKLTQTVYYSEPFFTFSLGDSDLFGATTTLIHIYLRPLESGHNNWPCSTCYPVYASFLEETDTGEWYTHSTLFEYNIDHRRSGNGHSNGFVLAMRKVGGN
ncbi:MAG: hypothetical protein HeimC3_43960 [Candidatus Heimdallarchaeota archaeon LC_3]|nr:MAG: hypothetical protein HeimC3_43960 [Candidatus Heimdallarchaeota archaeon LC_3]